MGYYLMATNCLIFTRRTTIAHIGGWSYLHSNCVFFLGMTTNHIPRLPNLPGFSGGYYNGDSYVPAFHGMDKSITVMDHPQMRRKPPEVHISKIHG